MHLISNMQLYTGTLHDTLQAIYRQYAGNLHPVRAAKVRPQDLGLQGHENFCWQAPDGQSRQGNIYRAIQHYAQESLLGAPAALMWYACSPSQF
ncbi:MAG: hypothetical protein AAGF24_05630 [Cyanobacteria bacterium P01_H01_bin.121]